MAYAIAWNEAFPVGASTDADTLDTEVQNLKKSVRERMNDVINNVWETDANNPKTLKLSAISGTPKVANVYTNALFSLPTASTTVIDFVAETLDTDSFHDNSTNPSRLTVAAAGYFRVHTQLAIVSAAAADGTLTIRKNGTDTVAVMTKFHSNSGGQTETYDLSVILLAAANDYFEVLFARTSAGSWTTGQLASNSYFEIERLVGTT